MLITVCQTFYEAFIQNAYKDQDKYFLKSDRFFNLFLIWRGNNATFNSLFTEADKNYILWSLFSTHP